MSEFVTIKRFEDHCKARDLANKTLQDDVKSLWKEMGRKVTYVVFWSIVMLLVGIVGGMWSLLYLEVKHTQQSVQEISNSVSYMSGILDGAEITE